MSPTALLFFGAALLVSLLGLPFLVRLEAQRQARFRILRAPLSTAGSRDSLVTAVAFWDRLTTFGAQAASVIHPVGTGQKALITRLLRDAGYSGNDALGRYLAAKTLGGLLCAAGAGWGVSRMTVVTDAFAAAPYLIGVGGYVFGGILCERVLRALAARVRGRMAAALPDSLDLLVMCRNGGLTFERALATVADAFSRVQPHLAQEFALFERELQMGGSRAHAMAQFAERTPVDGIRTLVFSLQQSERYGTPLNDALATIARTERAQQAARVARAAQRLPVLMTLPMLLLVVPGMMLLVAGPSIYAALDALKNLGGGGL